jgi:hypothetical protein
VFLSSLDGTLGFKIIGENELDFAGYSVSTAGDLNGDGLDDMILGAIQSDPNNREDSGQVYVIFANRFGQPANLELSTLNGTNGFKITGDQSDDNLGLYANELGDFNGDGLDDFVLGTNEASSNGFSRSGDAYVVFGSTSYPAEIGAGEIAGNYGLFFGGVDVNDRLGRVDAAGDVNGDGYDDLILGAVGASGTNNALITSGESYVIFGVPTGLEAGLDLSSLNGLNGFALHGVSFGDQSGFSVSSAGDVNGDGFDDIVIGARLADPGGVQTGEAYLFYGGDHSDAVTHLGTDANDTLTGDGGANVIVGGLGDDQLIGILGADTLRGGQGNDELLIDGDDFFRIDGGSGHDILGWRGTGAALDLTTIPDNRIQDIEQVDLIGISSRLIVDQLDVLNLSSTTNTLLVTGDSNDSVEIDSDWVETGTDVINGETFRVFEFGNAILKIHEDVGATGGMIGDFDSDGDLDCADVDALIAQMIAGTNDPDFDLNEDGFVDVGDLNNWILDRKGTLFGDANLDFVVDVSDFNAWNGNRFTSNTSWCGGNFNGDNVTDVTDFNTWSANKFRFALRPTATPDTDPNPTDRPTILADVENPSSATDDAAPTPLQSPRDYTVARRTTTARWRSLVDSVWEAETATPQLATAPQPFSSINR